ncbi:MAG: LytTR family DNA-binding domain-containing protein [Bacteroidales bacterium]|nr:LytTR family DNA-binding domain-containing protein [Bacteroidales bacterium]
MEKTTIKALIIDDEELARKVILRYLEKHPEIEIVGECENGFAGLKAINENKPDLVFLDIQMPKINGFELLEVLEEKPLIIFSTAHDEFALKAFEHSALDYLLKPYSQKRFTEAVAKALSRIQSGLSQTAELEKLNHENEKREDYLHRIVVKEGSQVHVIPCGEIITLEAADDYVEIQTKSKKYLKQKPLSFFETRLHPDHFIRVHRSTIVAVSEISRLEPYSKDNFILILKNGKEVNVSKSGMKLLRDKLNF